MKKLSKILSVLLCLAMLVGVVAVMVGAEESAATATLVTSTSDLAAGDKIVIVAADYDYALSTIQNTNNRKAVAITKSGNEVTLTAEVQILTVEAGTKEGTFAFNTGSGYLYAASNSKNYLRTESSKSDNSSWSIAIDNGTSVVAQGSNSRNVIQFNLNTGNGDPLFACYSSASQKAITIYKVNGSTSEETTEGTTEAAPVLPEADSTLTVAEANEAALAAGDSYTPDKYYITGKVTSISNTQYGNLYIEDETGSIYIYGLYDEADNRFDAMETKPAVGDTITVYTVLGTYRDAPQAKNATMTELVPGEVEVELPEAGSTLTVEEALAIAPYADPETKYYITGLVTGYYGENYATYGNLYIEDETGEILIYGLYNEDGTVRYDAMEVQPIVGDTITVYTALTTYNQVGQAKNAWLTDLVLGEGHEEEKPEESTGATDGTDESTGSSEESSEATEEESQESTGSNVSGDTGDKTPGDTLSVFVGLLAVSTVGLAVVTSKKKEF